MELKEFIESFIRRNSIIRLWYPNKSGHEMATEEVSMEWSVLRGDSAFKRFENHKVLGIASICTGGSYPEAINIVIERIPLDEIRNEKIEKILEKD